MEKAILRRLAETYLTPLFSGAQLETAEQITAASAADVAYLNNCRLAFKVDQSDEYRLVLFRSQPFYAEQEEGRHEKEIVSAFVASLRQYIAIIGKPVERDVLKSLQKQIVVKAVAEPDQEQTLSKAIDSLENWAGRLYEGRRITASIGILNTWTHSHVSMDEVVENDFSSVLSNGHDTIFVTDSKNRFDKLKALDTDGANLTFAPYRHAAIAQWTTDSQIAITLNREGEILLFKNKSLIFAKRAAKWNFLTQDAIITQMRKPQDIAVRKAVYESCLDSSFARSGACIGIITSGHMTKWKNLVTKEGDRLAESDSVKSQVLNRSISGKKFQALDRRLRLEMLSMDGATLLDYEGNILAAGAILKIDGGSEGGGRLAAAQALSSCGLGIKVSADGGIKGFDWVDNEPHLLFQVM